MVLQIILAAEPVSQFITSRSSFAIFDIAVKEIQSEITRFDLLKKIFSPMAPHLNWQESPDTPW